MTTFFQKTYERYKHVWTRDNLKSLFWGFLLFGLAFAVEHTANMYVGRLKGVAVGDLLLDHLPVLDIDFFIVQGALLITALGLFLMVTKPKYFIFSLKTLAVFILVRSAFISLTHLGVSPRELTLDPNSFGFGLYNLIFNAHNDFFFSGHTGLPFLMALIFWHEKLWRYVFLIASVFFAASVLFAHLHYSIDVFAAPFICYGIFGIAKYVFARDHVLITSSNVP